MNRTATIKALTTTAIALALMLVAATALAQTRDRNHDRIADRWERAHHLSLHVNQARRDQDHDGLRNLSEFRHGTNPRMKDSDRDGVDDRTEIRDHTNPDDAMDCDDNTARTSQNGSDDPAGADDNGGDPAGTDDNGAGDSGGDRACGS